MEDTYKTYSGYHYPNRGYEEGACDYCHQKHVKVRPLLCMKHFFCRVCEDFAPKFKRRDYRCTKCSTKVREADRVDLKMIDQCMARHVGRPEKPQFREIAVNFGGSDVVTFLDDQINSRQKEGTERKNRRGRRKKKIQDVCVQTTETMEIYTFFSRLVVDNQRRLILVADESESEDDLQGNNTEWDQLLEDLSSDSPTTVPKTTQQTLQKSSENQIPNQSLTSPLSRLCPHVTLQNLKHSQSEVSGSSESFLVVREDSPVSDRVSRPIHQESELKFHEPELISTSRSLSMGDSDDQKFGTATPYPSHSEIENCHTEDFGAEAGTEGIGTEECREEATESWQLNATESEEIERGTSPIKVCRRPVRRIGDLTSGSSSDSEIGEIEGPMWYGTSYSDDCLTEQRKEEQDDFWD